MQEKTENVAARQSNQDYYRWQGFSDRIIPVNHLLLYFQNLQDDNS